MMPLCRVIYKINGQISIIHPAPKARLKDESDQVFLNRVSIKACKGTELEGLDYEDIDSSNLPDRKFRDKWRGDKQNGIRIDHSVITAVERKEKIEKQLDIELVKNKPDVITVIRLQRELQKNKRKEITT